MVYGSYFAATLATLADVGKPSGQDPLFPEAFDKLQNKIYNKAKHIDTDLLDPYDAINFREFYLRKGFYQWEQNTSAEIAVCERRSEDWQLSMTVLAPATFMFAWLDETAPVRPTSYGAWVLDSTLFAYYVGQVEQAIAAVQQRTEGDWWGAVHSRIIANGGVMRAAWVSAHLGTIAFELSWVDPMAAPQPVKLYLEQRGYVMTPTEEAYLDDVLTRYYNAQQEFLAYSLSVTPTLTDPIATNDWFVNYGWTSCFGYTNGLWYYNMNADDLMEYFQALKTESENLAAQLLVQRDALWPADSWMPWQDTYLHYAFPEGLPNPLNITGWGFDPVQCDTNPATGAPYFGDALNYAAYRYYNQRYQLYNAANGPTPQYDVTLIYGGCAPFAGNAYVTFGQLPRNEQWTTPTMVAAQNPILTLNLTYSVLIHEMKHTAQAGMIMQTACPTCYSTSQALLFDTIPGAIADIYAIPRGLWRTYSEGPAVDTESQAIFLGMENQWETFHALMYRHRTRLIAQTATAGIRVGYWDLAGAMAWINQYSWFPAFYSPVTIGRDPLRDMRPNAGWYTLGDWKVRVARERAQERCGSNYNAQTFNTLTHSLPFSSITAFDTLIEDYITAGCVSPTTRFGDARRTVVAPSLQ
jgi:hypothetical protein